MESNEQTNKHSTQLANLCVEKFRIIANVVSTSHEENSHK